MCSACEPDSISPSSINLSEHVRELVPSIRETGEGEDGGFFAAESCVQMAAAMTEKCNEGPMTAGIVRPAR
jgi:hypothetical protein